VVHRRTLALVDVSYQLVYFCVYKYNVVMYRGLREVRASYVGSSARYVLHIGTTRNRSSLSSSRRRLPPRSPDSTGATAPNPTRWPLLRRVVHRSSSEIPMPEAMTSGRRLRCPFPEALFFLLQLPHGRGTPSGGRGSPRSVSWCFALPSHLWLRHCGILRRALDPNELLPPPNLGQFGLGQLAHMRHISRQHALVRRRSAQ
jgi:hypothetical protein